MKTNPITLLLPPTSGCLLFTPRAIAHRTSASASCRPFRRHASKFACRNVDPGLVGHIQGNLDRTRIYPLPANDERLFA